MEISKLIGKSLLMIHNGGEKQSLLYRHICDQLGMSFRDIADKPNEQVIGKIAGRLHIKMYEEILFRYYKKTIDECGCEFDYILVIRGEYTPAKAISYLRKKNPNAMMILYMWDSIQNNRGIKDKWPLFDKVYTFDRNDYLQNSQEIGFIPLFFCEEYLNNIESQTQPIYDIAFIGTAHGDRAKVVKQIEEECRKNNLTMFVYLYSPHILVYYYNKLFNKDYKYINKKDLSFQMMTQKHIYEIYSHTKCVLDIEIKTQTGLTMRTMDILGLKKKLLTTNPDIVHYDFYNPNNILLLDRENVSLNQDFLNQPYIELSKDIYEKYSMKSWMIQLLSE